MSIFNIFGNKKDRTKIQSNASDLIHQRGDEGSENEYPILDTHNMNDYLPESSKVIANPTLAGTEANLTGLQVDDTKYKVEQPIDVEANPVLAGTESALTGLKVGETKYKVEAGGGGALYLTTVSIAKVQGVSTFNLIFIFNRSDNTPLTFSSFCELLTQNYDYVCDATYCNSVSPYELQKRAGKFRRTGTTKIQINFYNVSDNELFVYTLQGSDNPTFAENTISI